MVRRAVVLAVFVFLGVTGPAQAAAPASILDGQIPCGVVTDEGSGGSAVSTSLGQVWCGTIRPSDNTGATVTPAIESVRSTAKTTDGVPLDINFAMPDPGTFGPPPYPTLMAFHGYGGNRFSFRALQRWLDKGYATYSITARGFDESCLSAGSKAADPEGCAKGYIHLIDQRFEIRDTQNFIGNLVDEGLVQPDGLAAWGVSYGGGHTLSFAALKDRMMNPDGTLVPWTSPDGTPISIKAAVAQVPPTDLPYILAPSGWDLDYIADSSYIYKTRDGRASRVGILKEGWAQGLAATGFTAPIGTDPGADLQGWLADFEKGEPYDGKASIRNSIAELARYHSPYGIDSSEAPAPMFISAGYNDDLVPAVEELRLYNRTRARYPDLPITLFLGSLGHPRGQIQANVSSALRTKEDQWTDYYLGGTGTRPASEVISYTQTCPNGGDGGGPYTASDWASLSPGEIRLKDAAVQTIGAAGGDPAIAGAWNGVTAGQNPCGPESGSKEPGSANWDLAPAPAGGYTMQGSPTVIADIDLGDSPNSEIAGRLVDLSPDGTTKILVARTIFRPWPSGVQVFQLHPNAWKVEEGHALRLELLAKDAAGAAGSFLINSFRPADGQGDITVRDMELRIPVVETPGALGGLVKAPAKKVLPDRRGVKLAPGYAATGALAIDNPLRAGSKGSVRGKSLKIALTCPASYTNACPNKSVTIKGAPKKGRGRNVKVASASKVKVPGGKTKQVTMKLTAAARKLFRDLKRGKRKVKGLKSLRVAILVDGRQSGYATVRRAGRVR